MAWLTELIGDAFRRSSAETASAERRVDDRRPAEGESVNLEWRDGDGRWRTEPVEACDVSEKGIGLLVEHAFEPGQIVYVLREDGPAMQGAVRHVGEAGESYRVGLALIPRERRRMQREEASGEAALFWTSRSGESIELQARVRNVSEGGIQLETPQKFDHGTVVRLRGSHVECLASVRYSIQRGDVYFVGLQMIGEPALDLTAE